MSESIHETEKLAPMTNSIAIVVPEWLQVALTVLIESLTDFKLIARVSAVEQLLNLDMSVYPDLILLDIHTEPKIAQIQLGQIKNKWPETYCIVLTRYTKDRSFLLAYGADEVLIEGVSPQRLIDAIRNFRNRI